MHRTTHVMFAVVMLLALAIQLVVSEEEFAKCRPRPDYEVVVIGGGPSGLQAALTLGRAMIKTLVVDARRPRNWFVEDMHNLLGMDGRNPAEFRKGQREYISQRYGTYVTFREDSVISVSGKAGEFVVQTKSKTFSSSRILLALGQIEFVPSYPLKYASQYYKSIFQCPYCHGFEVSDTKIALMTPVNEEYARIMKLWSTDLIVFTNGTALPWLSSEAKQRLSKAGLKLEETPVADLDIIDDKLKAIVLTDGRRVERDFIYQKFKTDQHQLVYDLNLELDQTNVVKVSSPAMQTSREGIYAAGDMTTLFHQAFAAIASGGQAAIFLSKDIAEMRESANFRDDICVT